MGWKKKSGMGSTCIADGGIVEVTTFPNENRPETNWRPLQDRKRNEQILSTNFILKYTSIWVCAGVQTAGTPD